jgi:hypothetical protein
MDIKLNERDKDRLDAIAKYRGMTREECAIGLIQQSLKEWETSIRDFRNPAPLGR